MPRKKSTRKKGQTRQNTIPQLRMSESYASFILGFAVVVLAIILVLSFFKGGRHTATSSDHTQQLPTETIQKTIQATEKSSYTVQEGDTFWSIAESKLGSGYRWDEIAKANNITDAQNLEVGTKLVIPQGEQVGQTTTEPTPTATPTPAVVTATPTAAPTPQIRVVTPSEQSQPMPIASNSYTVVSGDTLWDIAVRAYGDGFRYVDIAKANNLSNPDLIFSGNVFTIPR